MMRLLLSLLVLSLSLVSPGWGKKDKPDIELSEFDNQPVNVLYFEDSDVILVSDPHKLITYRSDDGGKVWKPLDGVPKGEVMEVLKHPYNNKVAVVLGQKRKHWISKDRGETWREFTTDDDPSRSRPGIVFHATDPDRMLFQAEKCEHIFFCSDLVYYTTDGFESKPKLLSENAITCLWAKSTDIFTTGDDVVDKDGLMCVAKGKFDGRISSNNRVITTSDYFKTPSTEPAMSDGKTVEGITNLAAVKKYLVFAAKSERSTEMAMYVSDDMKTWHRAQFGEHKLEEDAYTLLESTNYSMQVDVMTTKPTNPMGVLLTSNSNGTFFTRNIEHTNRNTKGYVDFEKVSNIQGIVLVNTVDNWEDVERSWKAERNVVSQISFDDGREWQQLNADGKRLHLHSVTKQRNSGRIFSSPAPGIVMGVGNTGKYLKEYDEGDLYVSDDAGVTWTKALSKPHIYEFGAQGSVLVAVADGETDEIRWSLNHGKDWEKTELEHKVKPYRLTTTPDSTSLKFLILATQGGGSSTKHVILSLDFNKLHERKCKDDDFEDWPARVDNDGKATCIMGHKQTFKRRKAKADCVVENKDFQDPEEKRENCRCTKSDFECDYNFKREDGKCVAAGPIAAPDGACDGGKENFKGTSGYRLIPGNTCKGGENLAEEVERPCTDTKKPPVTGKVATEITKFDAEKFVEYYYLEHERKSEDDGAVDETIIMRTKRREVWITHNHGKKWERILKDEEILAVYPHQYDNSRVYLITPTEKVFYSKDWGKHFHSFDAPEKANRAEIQVMSFHPTKPDWLIWTGGKDCKLGDTCQTIAHVTTKGGDEWKTLLRSVRKCQFVYQEGRERSDKLVYCEQYEKESPDSTLLLMSSDDWFDNKKELKRDVINFATMSEFIVVAVRDEKEETLKVDASIDGTTFADAQFPRNFQVAHQQAYTVLDSSTHAIFLHVTVNNNREQEYGTIIKSNSNGTSYVLSAAEVNRNEPGYVDFEKMQGLEGVAIINRVVNAEQARGGSAKKLKTYITHNDGAAWALLGRPNNPPNDLGEKFSCDGSDKEECSLHLHGYTERKDPRDTFSSPSAVGLMMGTGNVGEFLGYKKDADTFITRDGGLNWDLAAKGNWMWEYGDQGSIIVIVKEDEPTDKVRYTLDEGKSWIEAFIGTEMIVNDISTVPSDTSRNFLLWGKIGDKISTVNLDFSSLEERSRECKLDEDKPTKGDYDLWSPSHPLSENNCLFGHVAEYHRKRPDAECYNGRELKHLHNIAKNCTCTRQDFECDFNYEPDSTGACVLVKGYDPPDPKEVCLTNKDQVEYYEITGYRRIPLTTCSGGKELDYTSTSHPCKGHEEEYEKKHGIGGVGLFFAIVIPIAAASGIGYWVWKNWDGKFGRIRLGDGGYGGGAFDGEQPWIKYPVMAISGIVAVLAALPMLVDSLWRMVSSRMGRGGAGYARPYTSRSSFQRGTGDYAVVDEDEGELLGEDSDEDV